MIKFVLDTNLKELPKNCGDCPLIHCWLPETADGKAIKKPYLKRRYKGCPLRVVPDKEEAQ